MTSRCCKTSPVASAASSSTIVESNRCAIKNLLQGNRAEALVLFQQALNTARSMLVEADQQHLQQQQHRTTETDAMDDDCSSHHASSSSSSSAPSTTAQHHLQTTTPLIESIPVGAVEMAASAAAASSPSDKPAMLLPPEVVEGSFRFYDCAFDLSDACLTTNVLAHPDYQLEMSAVLIYNMALVYHQVGLLTGNSRHLYKALNLYEMGALIFETPTTEHHHHHPDGANMIASSSPCGLELLQLSLYNNMAHIHRHFMNGGQASRCEYMLHEALVHIQRQEQVQQQAQVQEQAQQEPVQPHQQVLSNEHLGFFTVNVFFANTRMSCAPAA